MVTLKNKIGDILWTLDIAVVPGSLIRRFKKSKLKSKKEKNIAKAFIYSIETARIFTYYILACSIYDKIAG